MESAVERQRISFTTHVSIVVKGSKNAEIPKKLFETFIGPLIKSFYISLKSI